MKNCNLSLTAVCVLCGCFLFERPARGDLWWDTNGATVGALSGATAPGNWYNASNWTTDPAGTSTTKQWDSGETAVFAAGANATGAYTVNVTPSASVKIEGLRVEEGSPTILTTGGSQFAFNDSLPIDSGPGTLELTALYHALSGPGVITKTGSGTFYTLQTQTIYAGKWVVDDGWLAIDNDLALGVVPAALVPDQIAFDNGGELQGTSSYNALRGIVLGAGGGGFWENAALTVLTWQGPISGSAGGALIQDGYGTTLLTNTTNSYDGETLIRRGRLRLGAASVIPNSSVVRISTSDGIFDLNGFNETVKSLAGAAGDVNLGTATLTLSDPAGEVTGSSLSASVGGKIIKNGAGAITFSGNNTSFSGEFVLNSGTIGVGHSNAFGNSASAKLTINGGLLANDGAATRTIAAVPVGLNADFAVDDLLNAAPGPIVLDGISTMSASRTITVNGNAVLTLSDLRQSTAGLSLTKAGAGTLELRSANYSGGTTVSRGMLLVTNTSGSGTGSGTVTVDAGSTLGGTGTIGGVVLNSGRIAPGVGVGTLTTGSKVTMFSNSHLAIDVSGTSADKLIVGGNLNLSGTNYLDVTGSGTGPWLIATYGGVLSGAFDHVTPGYAVDYGTPGQLILEAAGLAGDYNRDGKVNAADYVLWRKTPSSYGGSPTGYNTWRANFGNSAGGGGALSTAASIAVPEPDSLELIYLAVVPIGIGFCSISRRVEREARASNIRTGFHDWAREPRLPPLIL